MTVKGKGSRVPKVSLAAGLYVVSWTAKGGMCIGSSCFADNFIVDIVGADGQSDGLINEIPAYKGDSGETTYTISDAGTYLLKVQATQTWTITFTPQ